MRHSTIGLACAAAAAALTGGAAYAQNYPVKVVRFVVTYPAGGSSDAMARIIGAPLTEMWGQQVIVDSRPGAAGAIGMEYAAKQPADGYTFLLGNFGPVVANPLLQKVNYNAQKDFVPVSQITSAANILVVPNAMPVRNVKELVALCRARPNELVYATSGPGSMSHLAGEMFKRITNVRIEAVAYKGGVQSIADLMGGHIPMMFSDAQPVMANIKFGKLRALAVTSEKRTPFTPQLPTLAEEGIKGFAAANWWGILFPTGVPRPIIDKVATDLSKVLARQDVKDKMGELGIETVWSTPEQFGRFMENERARWGKLIREANIKIE
ncbi:MAG TPA: tripartite tricarboxylate transporter substrate binding protein [Burkholderiales bacterium]|nr:tripartite tricarboxylate transporter substrate binding protein [Burkholderiales bacterium]